ncbi:MAG: CDP-glycerol glycerophosphotransferase family protein [Candidatus Cloacimonadota bacterium]|nr:CDP-glycerol glycerophosphotransferase family protein [Candidatus Cloacimonadota bacterium]
MKILFYISKNYSIPIIEPLVKYFNKRTIEFSFFVSDKVLKAMPDYWKEIEVITFLQDAIDYNPDFVLVPGNFVDFRIPGIKVELFHGLAIEKKSHYKIRHFFDAYFTSGKVVTDKFMKLQQQHKYFFVKETGWPKIDHILNYNVKNLRKKFGISKNKKVILFAPTHSRTMQSASMLIPQISKIIKDDEIWFVKFHELMNQHIVDNFTSRNQNIIQIKSYDITPYLHIADVLVSDTSSVIYEFMILNKPIVTYNTKGRADKGLDIDDSLELRIALDKISKYPQEYMKNYDEILKEVNPYLDGNISKNILDSLIEIKKKDLIPKKKKPLNLFRKAQILFHERYNKGYLR